MVEINFTHKAKTFDSWEYVFHESSFTMPNKKIWLRKNDDKPKVIRRYISRKGDSREALSRFA